MGGAFAPCRQRLSPTKTARGRTPRAGKTECKILFGHFAGNLLDRGHGCGEILHVAGHDQLGGLAVSDLLHGLHAAQAR